MAHSHWLQGLLNLYCILLLRNTRLLSDQLTIRPFHNHLTVSNSLV